MAIKAPASAWPIFDGYTSSTVQSANFSSNPYDTFEYSNYAFQINVTSASGLNVSGKVQESLDGSNWADVPGSAVSFTANGAYIWRVSASAAPFARMSFTFSAGSALFYGLAYKKLG